MDQVYRPLGSEDLHQVKFIAIQEAVDFVLYGVQLTLSTAAITILARRRGRSRFTLVAILGLFLSSTIFTVADKIFYLVQFPVYIGTSERAIDGLLDRLSILLSVAKTFNFVLSDVVLIWRAWCLWPDSYIVKSILSLCGCGSVVGGIAESAWIYWPSLYDPYRSESNGQFLVRFVPLLMTNIIATVLIGTKVMHHRREVRGSFGLVTQRTQAETILLLLLESGVAYILFLVVDCAIGFVTHRDGLSGGTMFTDISHHIAGLYPTCVIFAASGGRTDSLLSAQVSQAMRFADPPAAHEGAREADTTTSSQPKNSNVALDDGSEPEEEMHVDRVPSPSGTRSDESRFASREGIIEVERETTTM